MKFLAELHIHTFFFFFKLHACELDKRDENSSSSLGHWDKQNIALHSIPLNINGAPYESGVL